MSDWAVGDLAVCVDDPACACCGKPVPFKIGDVYRVTAIEPATPNPGLVFAEFRDGFGTPYFRKIRPDEHEACETEFVTLVKRSKRKVDA